MAVDNPLDEERTPDDAGRYGQLFVRDPTGCGVSQSRRISGSGISREPVAKNLLRVVQRRGQRLPPVKGAQGHEILIPIATL